MMKARDIMNREVITLSPELTVREASRILLENHINGAPVVDAEGKLIGIVTVGDIINLLRKRMESLGFVLAMTPFDILDFYAMELAVPENRDALKEISSVKISEIMKRRVHFVREDDDILEVIEILAKKGVSRVPVVDSGGKVIGIITRSDIIRMIADGKFSEEVPQKVSQD